MTPETAAQAREAHERYRIGYDVNRDRWFVYDRETDERIGRAVRTRDEAIERADRMNLR